jgi:PAS domain S-box-containing protein
MLEKNAILTGYGISSELYSLLEEMPDGYLVTDGVMAVFANRALEAALGYSADVQKWPLLEDLVNGLQLPSRLGTWSVATVKTSGSHNIVFNIYAGPFGSTGNLYFIQFKLPGIYDNEDVFIMAKLSQAVDQSGSCIVITDTLGNIEFVNKKFEEITGYGGEEVLGKNPRVLKSGYHRPEYYEDLWKTISAGKVWKGILVNKKKNMDIYWESAVISPVIIADKIVSYIAVKEDISEKVHSGEELMKAKQIAEQASMAKSYFLANMSHELRTPLNGIMGMTGLLKKTALDDEQMEYMELLESSSKNLHRIVEDLLDFARIDSGKLALRAQEFNLKEIMDSTLISFLPEAQKKNLPLYWSFEGQCEKVVSDPDRLVQIVNNLVSNGLKFTENGFVRILFRVGEKLEIVVEDTGIGIDTAKIPKIFDSFSQLENPFIKEHQGLGLGLSIVRQLVDLLEGIIDVDSTLGKGSSFTVKVPLTQAAEHDYKKNDSLSNASDARILVAEDESINRLFLVTLLKKEGYNVDEAANGKEAVRMACENPYDLILMDISMPILNGIDASRSIRQAGKNDVPIVALTAHAYPEDAVRCMDAGMNDVVTKPLDQKMLLSKIELLISGSGK